MSSNRLIALKRISNDIREINNSPLEGIGIISKNNNPMEYIVNIQLMMGIYKDYCVQLLLTFTDNYPTIPPKIVIFPGQYIDHHFHHHIYEDRELNGFKGFCFDLLKNDFMETNVEHSGWNPSYTISTILLQVQNFLCDPDLPKCALPNNEQIKKLMKSMDNYKRKFEVRDQYGITEIVHTWKDPYPKMHFSYTKMGVEDENYSKLKNENEKKMQIIKDNLTCYMLRDNYIDNPDIILGYPIVQNKSTYGKGKIELYPIPNLLTYEAYQTQNSEISKNVSRYFGEDDNKLKSANNEYFNNWLPIYADQKHYNKNKQTILNSLKAIKNEPEFKPEQIFDILPIILNKMIIGMFNGKSIISSAFITCYFQYVLLFKKLCQEYEDDYKRYVDKKINLIKMNDYDVNKNIVPDIGNFFMLLFLSNKDMDTDEMKKMKYILFEEFFTRQMFWIFHGNECKVHMKSLISKNFSDSYGLYDSFKVDEILKNNKMKNIKQILKYAYESQRGNQLLLITFFALKKIAEKDFMDELEKNYGIFIDVDKFVQDMKQKLKEIKKFKDLYEYIGSEFGKDKTELELIIEGYAKAKEKGYIRAPYPKKNYNNNYQNYNYRNGTGRGYNNIYNNNQYGFNNQYGYYH